MLGPEYGATRVALGAIFMEAEYLSEIHSKLKNQLNCGEFQDLHLWQKCSFTPAWSEIKEYKKMKKAFKKVQKPYAKRLKKVDKAKRIYYRACANQKILMNQMRHAAADLNISSRQVTHSSCINLNPKSNSTIINSSESN